MMSGAKSETAVVSRALEILRFRHPRGFFWRANSGSNGKAGHRCNSENLPDLCGVNGSGMAYFVEVKTKDGRLTDEQLSFLGGMEKRGARVEVFVDNNFYDLADVPESNLPRRRK